MEFAITLLVTFFAGMGAGLGTGFAGMSAAALKVFGPHFARSCQNATALAAATLSESTPCAMGIFTV